MVPICVNARMITAGAWLAALGCTITGCTWRPASDALRRAPGVRVQLSARQAPVGSRLTYRCSDPTRGTAQPLSSLYESVVCDDGRLEGDLVGTQLAPLTDYLGNDATGGERRLRWPQTDDPAWAFYLVFDPPLGECPAALTGDEPVSCASSFSFYNWRGRKVAWGKVTRQFRFDGYEDLTVGGQRYPECVRVHVVTIYATAWFGRVKTSDYLWLAPHVGAVRRIQRISGSILASRLDSVSQWDIERIHSGTAKSSGSPLFGAWRRVAVHLSPTGRQPRLVGLAIESPASRPGSAICQP